jgi:Phage tail tube protein
MTAAAGTLAQLGIDSANPTTIAFDFVSESMSDNENFIDASGVRGTRSRFIDRVRADLQHVGGQIVMQPNSYELSKLLPWWFGGTPSGSGTVTYPLADTLPARFIQVDRILKVMTYAGCVPDTITLRASQGEPMSATMDIIGQTETLGNAGSFPVTHINTANGPFILSDLVITLGGTTITPKSVELVIRNGIDRERFFNSVTYTGTPLCLDRNISFRTLLPYGDFSTLYNSGAPSGVIVVMTFTYGAAVLVITMNNVAFPRRTPVVPGRQEIMLPIEGTAYGSSTGSPAVQVAGSELTCTLNIGP